MSAAPLYVVGLDLGQTSDYSALCIAERTEKDCLASYAVRHLHRYPLRTAYTAIGSQLQEMLAKPPLPDSTLAVDQTGVGRAVVDILHGLNLPASIVPVTITAGHKTTREDDGWHVPKKELVGVVQVLLQSGRLVFADKMKLAAVAKRELEMFRTKVSVETGHESFEAWRERDHDDIVLAVALACWAGEHAMCGPWEVPYDRGAQYQAHKAPPGVFLDNPGDDDDNEYRSVADRWPGY